MSEERELGRNKVALCYEIAEAVLFVALLVGGWSAGRPGGTAIGAALPLLGLISVFAAKYWHLHRYARAAAPDDAKEAQIARTMRIGAIVFTLAAVGTAAATGWIWMRRN